MLKKVYAGISALLLTSFFLVSNSTGHAAQKGFILIGTINGKGKNPISIVREKVRPTGVYCREDGWCLIAVWPGHLDNMDEFLSKYNHAVIDVNTDQLQPYEKGHRFGRVPDSVWQQLWSKAKVGFMVCSPKFALYYPSSVRGHYDSLCLIWPKSKRPNCFGFSHSLDVTTWQATHGYWRSIFHYEVSGCSYTGVDYSHFVLRYPYPPDAYNYGYGWMFPDGRSADRGEWLVKGKYLEVWVK